ncbi:hypothetical protein ILYODFUR_017860 [Ilyodon furcidens]|uniref:Uncharacterized protein n=1 Tax=Ilyodon furcidens TaxID=33524 RepID=A0ABV0TXD1_9TELE
MPFSEGYRLPCILFQGIRVKGSRYKCMHRCTQMHLLQQSGGHMGTNALKGTHSICFIASFGTVLSHLPLWLQCDLCCASVTETEEGYDGDVYLDPCCLLVHLGYWLRVGTTLRPHVLLFSTSVFS